jgi:hypothetical protein
MNPADTTTPGKSFAQLRAILQSDLPRAQKAVLTTLLAYARPDLTVYHAEADIARDSEYTVPTVRAALAQLLAQGVLTVRQKPRQHYATEYQIHVDKLKIRPPYRRQRLRQSDSHDGSSRLQRANRLPSDGEVATSQRANGLSSGEFQRVNHLPQHANDLPLIDTRETTTEEPFCADREPSPKKPSAPHGRSRSRPKIPASMGTPAPNELPITDDLQVWWDAKFSDLDLPRAIEKFLLYARAQGRTNADWDAAFRFYVLNGHTQQVGRNGQRLGGIADPIVEAVRHQPGIEASSPPEPPPGGEQAWERIGPCHGRHVECNTIHQFYGSCPRSEHQKTTPPTDHGPTPEYSGVILRQPEATASAV